MKIKKSAILLLVLLVVSVAASSASGLLHFASTGFSIAPLEAPAGDASYQALMMLLPAKGGFAGNVNVMIQPYEGTIDEYASLSLKQFKDAEMKVVQQAKAGKSGYFFEYTGVLQGRALHWYSRAEKSGNHVYLATATATERDWPKQSAQLKACVDSFRCDNGS
jgi:hypothetical protein